MKVKLLVFCFLMLSFHQSFGQNNVYFNQTELGVLFGNGVEGWNGQNENRVDFSLITFHGVKFSKNHAVGMSVGLDQYNSISIIPIAVGWRGFLGKENRPQLMGGFDLGGGSTLLEKKEKIDLYESRYHGGLMFSPSIGFKFPARKGDYSLTMTLAYKRQEFGFFQGYLEPDLSSRPSISSSLPPGYSSITETSYLYHSLVARVGIIF